MSTGPIATAFVKVVPDTTTFQRDLQTAVNRAVRNVTVPAVGMSGVSGVSRSVGGSASALSTATKSAAKSTQELTKTSQALRGALIGVSHITPVTVFGLSGYGVAAIAVGSAVKSAISATADFEHQLNVFQATTAASADQMIRVQEEAKQLGADLTLPAVSAADAALAMTELAKAGLDVEQTLDAAQGVLRLSAAGQLDVGTAANFVATELNAFGLAGDQATHVADVLAASSIAAQGSLEDFANAFQQVGAVSKQVGLSFEGTAAVLTELAKAGLKGADGGTSLRTGLLRLAPTTKQAAQYMEALGIQIDKTRSIGAQLPNLFDQYKASLAALNPIQQQQALTQVFGQDAIRGMSIAIEGGSAAYYSYYDAVTKAGQAERLALANAKGLTGAINGLKSNAENLGLALGDAVKGPMTDFIYKLSLITQYATEAANALLQIKWPSWLGGGGVADFAKKAVGGALFLPGMFLPPPESENAQQSSLGQLQRFGGRGGILQSARYGPVIRTAKERAEIQKKIAALNKAEAKNKPRPGDTAPTPRLQIAQYRAQLKGDLQAEVTADRDIENYYRERLKLADKGTSRYATILGSLQQAHANTQTVLDRIDSIASQAASDRDAKRKKAQADREREAREAKQNATALFNLQKSQLDLEINRATTLYPDNKQLAKQAYQREIDFLQGKIDHLHTLRKLTVEQKQQIVDWRNDIISLKGAQKSLFKDSSGGGGLTAEGLFGEAISSFRSFGSNIGTFGRASLLSPQDIRGQLAGQLIKNAPADKLAAVMAQFGQTSTTIASAQLAEQQRTNRLLGIISGVSAGTGKQFGYRGARVLGLEGKYAPGNENPWRGN